MDHRSRPGMFTFLNRPKTDRYTYGGVCKRFLTRRVGVLNVYTTGARPLHRYRLRFVRRAADMKRNAVLGVPSILSLLLSGVIIVIIFA